MKKIFTLFLSTVVITRERTYYNYTKSNKDCFNTPPYCWIGHFNIFLTKYPSVRPDIHLRRWNPLSFVPKFVSEKKNKKYGNENVGNDERHFIE